MTDEDFSDTDVPKDFSIISWFMSIPLCDDVWLGMQAQHIAAVEIGIILAQYLQPGTDVVRVTHSRNDTQRSADESTRHFGHKLFARVSF